MDSADKLFWLNLSDNLESTCLLLYQLRIELSDRRPQREQVEKLIQALKPPKPPIVKDPIEEPTPNVPRPPLPGQPKPLPDLQSLGTLLNYVFESAREIDEKLDK